MFPTLLLVIVCLVVAASAYDFSDENFNQLLSSQLTELSDLERVRRSATNEDKNDESDDESDEKFGEKNDTNCRPHRRGGQHHWKSCCGNGKWMKNLGDKDKSSVAECIKDVDERINETGKAKVLFDSMDDMFSCAKVNMRKMKAVCISECVGKKTGLLTEEGNLNSQKVRSYIVNDFFSEDWSKIIAEGVVDKCVQSTNTTNWKNHDEIDIKCNPEMLSFTHCIWTHIEKNCPETLRKQGPKCSRFFNTVKKSTGSSHD